MPRYRPCIKNNIVIAAYQTTAARLVGPEAGLTVGWEWKSRTGPELGACLIVERVYVMSTGVKASDIATGSRVEQKCSAGRAGDVSKLKRSERVTYEVPDRTIIPRRCRFYVAHRARSAFYTIALLAPEVVNATTGKLENGQPSMLCKQSMFARWCYLLRRGLPLLPPDMETSADRTEALSRLESLLYDEAKLLCPAYQVAKQRLVEAFDKAKLGKWVEKPLEQDQFLCELVDAEPTALFS
ncbi:Double-stranded RNA-specific editase 1 [Eumeta japonica]|uniref:Double-stranded RNA-specific editase 1 n=1 Tax=Eumeta variegata TaxID=151549 RepID=A0A4C1WX76_EUMVA|nr:Double-stranded RNA-specific editase 1 [Eumeta japonica]